MAFPSGSLDNQQLTGWSRGSFSASFFYQVSGILQGVVEDEEGSLFFA
jgi:hypothetical protein